MTINSTPLTAHSEMELILQEGTPANLGAQHTQE